MTRSQRMKRIVDLNDMQKSVAAQRLAASRARQDDAVRKLEDFQRYREEYAQNLVAPGRLASAADMLETRKFMTQLERTIGALEALVRRAQGECAQDLAAWKRESQRGNVLGDILGRYVHGENHEAEGRLQREIDDRARSFSSID